MKKVLILALLLVSIKAMPQVGKTYFEVDSAGMDLVKDIPSKSIVFLLDSNKFYRLTHKVMYSQTLQDAFDNDWIISVVGGSGDNVASVLFIQWVDSTAINTTGKVFIGYSDGIVIDTIIYVLLRRSGTPNITPKLWYGNNWETTGTAVISSPSSVTNYSTPTKIYSFNNSSIPIGNIVWLTFPTVEVASKEIIIIVKGHKL